MIKLGQFNKLKIKSQKAGGLLLEDSSGDSVLLSKRHRPQNYVIGDEIDVFVYLDSEENKKATTQPPKILFNEFASLKVTSITSVGAFMDWGLEKDLFVPFKEQNIRLKEGRWYVTYLDLDEKTDRLFGSTRLERHLQNKYLTVKENEQVEILVILKTDLGFTVIINNKHKGLLFKNEVFQELFVGNKLTGYIKKIHDDNKIDVSIQPIGYKSAIDGNTDVVYSALKENNGFLPITDKSSPEEISEYFGISKKAFKKAVGALYKQRKIDIRQNGIKLV